MYTAAIAAAYNHTFSILHIDFSLGCLGKAGSYWRAGFLFSLATAYLHRLKSTLKKN